MKIFYYAIHDIYLFKFLFYAVPRVSVDGQAHGTLTLAVCVAGVVIAVILIILIIVAMECGKVERFIGRPQKLDSNNPRTNESFPSQHFSGNIPGEIKQSWCSFASMCGRRRHSFDVEQATTTKFTEKHRQNSISTVMTDISYNVAGSSRMGSRETVFTIGVPLEPLHSTS